MGARKAARGRVVPDDGEPRVFMDPASEDSGKRRTAEKPPAVPKRAQEDPADVKARQEAFESEFFWNGELLEPYSISREALWLSQRLAVGAPPLSQCLADHDAFLGDALRILWLCSRKPGDWSRLRADPFAMQAAIDEWADENVRDPLAASTQAMRMYAASIENQHEAAPRGRKGSEELGN